MTYMTKVWQDLAQVISPTPNQGKYPLVARIYLFNADSPVPIIVPGTQQVPSEDLLMEGRKERRKDGERE